MKRALRNRILRLLFLLAIAAAVLIWQRVELVNYLLNAGSRYFIKDPRFEILLSKLSFQEIAFDKIVLPSSGITVEKGVVRHENLLSEHRSLEISAKSIEITPAMPAASGAQEDDLISTISTLQIDPPELIPIQIILRESPISFSLAGTSRTGKLQGSFSSQAHQAKLSVLLLLDNENSATPVEFLGALKAGNLNARLVVDDVAIMELQSPPDGAARINLNPKLAADLGFQRDGVPVIEVDFSLENLLSSAVLPNTKPVGLKLAGKARAEFSDFELATSGNFELLFTPSPELTFLAMNKLAITLPQLSLQTQFNSPWQIRNSNSSGGFTWGQTQLALEGSYEFGTGSLFECVTCEVGLEPGEFSTASRRVDGTLSVVKGNLKLTEALSTGITGKLVISGSENSSSAKLNGESDLLGNVNATWSGSNKSYSYQATSMRLLDPFNNLVIPDLAALALESGKVAIFAEGGESGGNVNLELDNLTGQLFGSRFSSLSLQAHTNIPKPELFQLKGTTKLIEAPILISDLSVEGALELTNEIPVFKPATLNFNALGARFEFDSQNASPLSDNCSYLPLKITGLELEQVMALYPDSNIRATGTLSGLLPISYCQQGLTIHPAALKSDSGGSIKLPTTLRAGHESVDLAFQALQDFDYSELEATLAMEADGEMKIALKFSGVSNSLPKPVPIALNLNVEENLWKLLKSISASKEFTDKVVKATQKQ